MSTAAICLTSILVSIDALFAGMSIGLRHRLKLSHVLISSLVMFTMCLAAYAIACTFKKYISVNLSPIAATLFLLLGIKNIFGKSKNKNDIRLSLGYVIIISILVAIDGALAALLITLERATLLVPAIFGVIQGVLFFGGSLLTQFIKLSPKMRNIISGLCLVLLAALKFSSVL